MSEELEGLIDKRLDEFRTFAEAITREAGELVAERFRRGSFEVEDKEDGSPVTEADRDAELLLRKRIESRFPEHGVIGEEFGGTDVSRDFVWVLDPIDGTKSFIHGVPLFGTLVGLLHENRSVIGCIFQPVLDQMAVGDNRTTFLNGEPTRVREARAISDSTLLLTDPSDPVFLDRGEVFKSLIREAGIVRSWGDCFGYLSLVSGKADAMLDPVLSPWDLLPLLPVLRGAGAIVSDFRGLNAEEGNSLIASSSREFHDRILECFAGGH
ncbi:MAG: inositol monophosphatase family protein [Verrucomicrobiota bacterium]